MSSGPVVAMVWEGLDVVKQGRQMLGATNPLNSMPGFIIFVALTFIGYTYEMK